MKKKLSACAGFSLVETLCAVAVLMLLCVMLNSGLSVAVKTYFDITAESETQLLLNSLTNAIAGELRYAYGVSGEDDPVYNGGLRLALTADGQVCVTGGPGGDKELLPTEKDGRGGAYHGKKYSVVQITEDDGSSVPLARYSEEDGCFTINFKVVWAERGISAQTPEGGVVIRCLNAPREPEGGAGTP